MSICENCGFDNATSKHNGILFREALEDRLTEYGFENRMTPSKYTACSSVRKVIRIRSGIDFKSGGALSEDDYKKALFWLDMVLPEKY